MELNRRSVLMVLGAGAVPVPAIASDPWEKDIKQWDEKDLQKIMSDSPWARSVSVSLSGPSVGNIGGGGRGGRGGGGGGSASGGGAWDASSSSGMGGGSMGSEGGGGAPGGGGGMGGGGGLAPSMTFLIRWQSAKPVKAALVRARMGAEADSSAQAKEFIERKEPDYVIAVIMPAMRGGGQRPGGGERKGGPGEPSPDMEARLKEGAWLSWKEHEKVHPTSVTPPKEGQSAFIFHFPKDHPIELADKEVEFAMKRGETEIKKKFRLKDMVFQGELAL